MIFSDTPELISIPRDGVPAVDCAVYHPRSCANGKRAGMILHLYGHGGSPGDCNIMREAYSEVRRFLRELGYWLIVPDLGGSHWMNDKACMTLDAVIDFMVANHGVDPANVKILGTSMGGGSGLVYTMRRPGRVKSICAVFPMTDFVKWTQETPSYLQRIIQAHEIDPAETGPVLQELSPLLHPESFAGIPVLLIHGDADSIVPVHHSRDFAAELKKHGGRITYHEVSGVGHEDAIAAPLQREIVGFLTAT